MTSYNIFIKAHFLIKPFLFLVSLRGKWYPNSDTILYFAIGRIKQSWSLIIILCYYKLILFALILQNQNSYTCPVLKHEYLFHFLPNPHISRAVGFTDANKAATIPNLLSHNFTIVEVCGAGGFLMIDYKGHTFPHNTVYSHTLLRIPHSNISPPPFMNSSCSYPSPLLAWALNALLSLLWCQSTELISGFFLFVSCFIFQFTPPPHPPSWFQLVLEDNPGITSEILLQIQQYGGMGE